MHTIFPQCLGWGHGVKKPMKEKLNGTQIESLVRVLDEVPSILSIKEGICLFNLLIEKQFELLCNAINLDEGCTWHWKDLYGCQLRSQVYDSFMQSLSYLGVVEAIPLVRSSLGSLSYEEELTVCFVKETNLSEESALSFHLVKDLPTQMLLLQ